MSWFDDFFPIRAELEREAYEDHMADTYETRYQQFCADHLLDPEDPASAPIYEQAWEEEYERDADQDRQ